MRRAWLLLILVTPGCSKLSSSKPVSPQDTVQAHPRPKRRRPAEPEPKGQLPGEVPMR
jgi:hypothetical protein